MTKQETTLAADLVEDFDLYPRENIDSSWVSALTEVLRAGDSFVNPVIACKESKRIVDGFHRRRAAIRVYGPETATVPVEWRDYESETEIYADACRATRDAKKPLTGNSLTHALLRGLDLGIKEPALAEILGIRTEKVHEIVAIRAGRVSVTKARGKTAKARNPAQRAHRIPLKQSVKHLWGTDAELTTEQATAHDSGPGTPQWLMFKQAADYLEYGLADLKDHRVAEQVERLRQVIEKLLISK